jgi:hypothetical protein
MRANFGRPWLALTLALALHVFDEATNDFLSWYNPTALAIRQRVPWLPIPVFGFTEWIVGLTLAVLLLAALTPLAYRGNGALRWAALALGVLMIANGVNHLAASIWYGRIMPGALSSPVLIAASVWLLRSAARVWVRGTRFR